MITSSTIRTLLPNVPFCSSIVSTSKSPNDKPGSDTRPVRERCTIAIALLIGLCRTYSSGEWSGLAIVADDRQLKIHESVVYRGSYDLKAEYTDARYMLNLATIADKVSTACNDDNISIPHILTCHSIGLTHWSRSAQETWLTLIATGAGTPYRGAGRPQRAALQLYSFTASRFQQ